MKTGQSLDAPIMQGCDIHVRACMASAVFVLCLCKFFYSIIVAQLSCGLGGNQIMQYWPNKWSHYGYSHISQIISSMLLQSAFKSSLFHMYIITMICVWMWSLVLPSKGVRIRFLWVSTTLTRPGLKTLPCLIQSPVIFRAGQMDSDLRMW